MSTENFEVLSAGVDWLTCTSDIASRGQEMQERAYLHIGQEVERGCKFRPFGQAGFTGWGAGQIQCAIRGTETLVRLSGALAHREWRPYVELAQNVSRLDLECTTVSVGSGLARISRAYARAKRDKAKNGWTNTVTIIRADDGTSTLYIGKRSSVRYGRVYLARATHRDEYPQEAVRAELELKGDPAYFFARQLMHSDNPSAIACGVVCSFFQTGA